MPKLKLTYFDIHGGRADLKVFEWVRLLESGMLDHIPVDLAKQQAPLLVAHAKKIRNHPKIEAYYQD